LEEFLEDLCENFGSKSVTRTDKSKGAFVLNEEQRAVLEAAGALPGDGGANAIRLTLQVPTDADGLELDVSYYNSVRKGAGRTPEARMGREIVHWMEIGDNVTIANVGSTVFVWKEHATGRPLNEVAGEAASEIDPDILLGRGRQASGKPSKLQKTVSDFRRNAAVVAGAVARADSKCEMPDCDRYLFQRPDGSTFLEVHHVVPLAEEGDDTMRNAAALCPTCHRELHYGEHRNDKREVLRAAIEAKEL